MNQLGGSAWNDAFAVSLFGSSFSWDSFSQTQDPVKYDGPLVGKTDIIEQFSLSSMSVEFIST